MVSAYGHDRGLTSWGWRNGKRIWRIRWDEKPGQVAEVTGPVDLMDALMKLNDEVLARLPWQPEYQP
jgi:hypothetical protein